MIEVKRFDLAVDPDGYLSFDLEAVTDTEEEADALADAIEASLEELP